VPCCFIPPLLSDVNHLRAVIVIIIVIIIILTVV
jgi:hypothetical protein